MPFALTFTGLLLIITGFQNTYKEFGAQVQSDFTGKNNFLFWMVAILTVGSLGYIKGFESFSRVFMALIVVAIVLSKNSGTANGITAFNNLVGNLMSGTNSAVNPVGANLQGGSSGSGGGSSSGGGIDLSNVSQDASIATTVAEFL